MQDKTVAFRHFGFGGDLTRGRNPAKSAGVAIPKVTTTQYLQTPLILKVMFSPKHLIGLILMSLLFASCAPLPPNHGQYQANPAHVPQSGKVDPTAKPKTPDELKTEAERREANLEANEEAAARRAKLEKEKAEKAGNNTGGGSNENPLEVTKNPDVKPKNRYRTAVSMPGKPGFVFNPWTNKSVDVRGIPGGSLVRDPHDGNPDHKFRVP